jgi:hypothetical protein
MGDDVAPPIMLADWWAVCASGAWFVGKRAEENGRMLVSLNKLEMQFSVQLSSGAIDIAPKTSVFVYPWFGVESLEIPEGALWIPLASMRGAPWAKMIANAEDLKRQQFPKGKPGLRVV